MMIKKYFGQYLFLTICVFQIAITTCLGETIVFFEKNFPSVENGSISRAAIEKALSPLKPRFVGLEDLQKKDFLAKNNLLVLPYGSAFPVDAWEIIQRHLENGNLLVLGGRPFSVPVYRDSKGWRVENPQNTYARHIGIENSYIAPQQRTSKLQWDDNAPSFQIADLEPSRVFVLDGYGGRYRGLAFLVDAQGNRISAPIVAEDFIGRTQQPRRRVYLNFDSKSSFWNSSSAIELIRQSAIYASRGGIRLWLDMHQLTINQGDQIYGTVDVIRTGEPAQLNIELLFDSKVIESKQMACGSKLHEEIGFTQPLENPGLYKVRATLSIDGRPVERYTSGVCVRDLKLLHSGERLEAGRDYFRLNKKPYLMAGTNYYSTDQYTASFVFGGSIGGNPFVWDNDFAEMEQQGLTTVRTGIWLNRVRYLDDVSGAASERLLRAIEAFLHTAARHRMQVIFTFFSFDPQTESQQGQGQDGNFLGPGSNPYLDPDAIEAQITYVRAIVQRFKDVPFLSYDLINEPSFCNPKSYWNGNRPNRDWAELAAWQRWLEKHYGTIEKLAQAWRVTKDELGAFDRVPLPQNADLQFARSRNIRTIRAVDYNLFAQDAFRFWIDAFIQAIRETGSNQAVTVGQDEGGVADRLINQFWAESPVSYTVNHSWWRDDALLWNSVAAKTPGKPNIIGETGPQPVWSMDGSSRWDEIQGTPLLERKLALAFANSGAGVLHWDWTRSTDFGILRRDGSQKQWMDVLRGISAFAHNAQEYATEAQLPDIALVMPQSLQFSMFGGWGLAAQQNAVRTLYQHTRATAFVIGEYQLSKMPDAKLIIVPAPWVMHQEAWEQLMEKVKTGATLLISGRIDADEHWHSIIERTSDWPVTYSPAALTTREVQVKWPGDSARLSYSGDGTIFGERGILKNGSTFLDIPLGKGRILYFSVPLEHANQLDDIGRIYKYAMTRAGASTAYETSCEDPGILICPTQLQNATLYVITSESPSTEPIKFRDKKSGADIKIDLAPGRAALLLVGRNGSVLASYNVQ